VHEVVVVMVATAERSMAALDATQTSNHGRGYCPLHTDSVHLYVMRYLPNNTHLFSLYPMF